jgi:hypothetical protein
MEAAYSYETFVPTNKIPSRHNLEDTPLREPFHIKEVKVQYQQYIKPCHTAHG